MPDSSLFKLSEGGDGRLARQSVKLLIGLQALLVMVVLAGVYLATSHLRDIDLENMGTHARTQTKTQQERLEQSLDLLQMHLRAIFRDNPEAVTSPNAMRSVLSALQQKLLYVRSISVAESDGEVIVSTQTANEGRQLDLGLHLPDVSPHTPDLMRFGAPWSGRDFSNGSRLTPDVPAEPGVSTFFPISIVLPQALQWTVVVAINSDYFINFAPEHSAAADLAFRTFLDDGTLLFSNSQFDQPGTRPLPEFHLEEIQERLVGSSRLEDEQGNPLLTEFRAARTYPWFIQAQVSDEFVLAGWQQETRQLWLISGLTLAVMLLVSTFLMLRARRSLRLEEQSLEQNRLAASVFMHSNDVIVIADGDKRIIAVNPVYEDVTGYSAHEALGRSLGQMPADRRNPGWTEEFWASLDAQAEWDGEVTKHHKDGSVITGWLQVNAIRNQAGRIINYIAVFKDLSRLRETEAKIRKLSLAIEQSRSSILMTTPEAKIEYANPEFFRSSGYEQEEVMGENPRILQSGQTPRSTYVDLWQNISTGKVWHGEFTNRRKDGTIYQERSTISPVLDDGGRLMGYLGITHDITAEKEAELNYRLAASVIAGTAECVMICDAEENIMEINPAFTRLTGFNRDEVIGKHPSVVWADGRNEETVAKMYAAFKSKGGWQGELWSRRKDGTLYVTSNSVSLLKDDQGNITHYVTIFSDITEARQHQETLQKQAHYDPLTGLPNRALLQEQLQHAVADAQQNDHCFAVCFMDLDGFKQVNDTLGHKAGDDLLTIIGKRLRNAVSAHDTVARIGGDEFVIVLSPVGGVADAELVAARILQAVAEPVLLSEGQANVTGSMGITLYPVDSGDVEQLLRHADHAMYQAKQQGRNRYVVAKEAIATAEEGPRAQK